MNEITDLMEKYRESTRHLWNTYFRNINEGSHEFINVNSALFEGLVLTHIGDRFDHNKVYDSIKIIPRIPPSGTLEIMYLPDQQTSGQWCIERLTDAQGEYRFIEFFDWRNDEDMMDNTYVIVQAYQASSNKKLENNKIMFKYSDVKFFTTK